LFDRAAVTDAMVRTIGGIRLVAFDFDGVFTDNMVYVFEDGREAVRCTRVDGIGLDKLRALNIESLIISTEVNPVVQERSRKLNLTCYNGCEDKGAKLAELLAERGLDPSQAAFVGNDINDIGCLKMVGFPIVVADTHPDVADLGMYRTRQPGGHGAVREVCDMFHAVISEG
jgi:3-deoxy-D-manno-octulosonate 8-phosphate phosphatase (KDO 8-P phosphatase)